VGVVHRCSCLPGMHMSMNTALYGGLSVRHSKSNASCPSFAVSTVCPSFASTRAPSLRFTMLSVRMVCRCVRVYVSTVFVLRKHARAQLTVHHVICSHGVLVRVCAFMYTRAYSMPAIRKQAHSQFPSPGCEHICHHTNLHIPLLYAKPHNEVIETHIPSTVSNTIIKAII
jgi:hypothetical protein